MITLESESTLVSISPEVGGRIVSFQDRKTNYEFLWHNSSLPLRREQPGAPYDPNFFGGIDELLPNDIPENIAGIKCPDHGELWTTPFEMVAHSENSASIKATMPLFDFELLKKTSLEGNSLEVATRIINRSSVAKPFLWKLHAALKIEPGDQITCSAKRFSVADAEWSRRTEDGLWNGETVPSFDDTTEFLYLHGLEGGAIGWKRRGKQFSVEFDTGVFPYVWYFASYGGFDGHRVAILEPCTCMPISVNEAASLGQSSWLPAGGVLETTYRYLGVVDED